jgi:ubiquinone/menaquinone biosynthesis C-methylase UbiE
MKNKKIKKIVKDKYSEIAKKEISCCLPDVSCCSEQDFSEEVSKKIGYTDDELRSAPEGANLGLGCGNPTALASLKPGETVLDLGCGAGFDSFLAANQVGETGKVIGIDMTQDMIQRAEENARKGHYKQVEFKLAEIENVPVEDDSVDVIISNCVINLSPDKGVVFEEAFRVLKPGGRLMITDIVLLKELPDFLRDSVEAYVGCVAGASLKEDYLAHLEGAGLVEVRILDEKAFPVDSIINDPIVKTVIEELDITREEVEDVMGSVVSIHVQAIKPEKGLLVS